MWQRLGRDDFTRTSEMRLERRQDSSRQSWKVCREGYDRREVPREMHCDGHQLVPKSPMSQEDKWHTYYPLEDTPDLFLSFARLDNAKDMYSATDAILNWVHKYGLLGDGGGAYGGGPEDNVENYLGLSYWAAGILAMYEAALNGDQEAAKDVVLREFVSVDPFGYDIKRLGTCKFAARKAERIEEDYSGSHLEYALDSALYLVTSTVREQCLPTLYLPEGVKDPSKVNARLGFKSLYGAMNLQMYWLMAAGGNVTRCGWCGRIISLTSPRPGARKTRQDKKFCDDVCRQRNHYHTKTKPRRQSKPF